MLLNRQTEENQKEIRDSKEDSVTSMRQEKRENLMKKLRRIEESYKNCDGAESKTRPSNLPDINLNQSELTRFTYLVRVNPHKSFSNSCKQ
jgi:hypothetical protein